MPAPEDLEDDEDLDEDDDDEDEDEDDDEEEAGAEDPINRLELLDQIGDALNDMIDPQPEEVDIRADDDTIMMTMADGSVWKLKLTKIK